MGRARLAVALLACLLAAVPAAATPHATPHVEGPDVPPVTAPVTVTAFEDEVFSFEERPHTATIAVPEGDWDRIVLELRARPDGDPWDRLFAVAIGDVEVLRGTTPRADFTVQRDVTEYASLLPAGATAQISLMLSTYVGRQLGTVRLHFHAAEPTADLVARPRAAVVGALRWQYFDAHEDRRAASVSFPASAPARAVVELTMTGHAGEEFWLQNGSGPWGREPRRFDVVVDGTVVASATSVPYTYAFFGIAGAIGEIVHPVVWWSALRAANAAGVHTGVGEIPPYRAEIAAEDLHLLAGARTVEVVTYGNSRFWVGSLSFLLD